MKCMLWRKYGIEKLQPEDTESVNNLKELPSKMPKNFTFFLRGILPNL